SPAKCLEGNHRVTSCCSSVVPQNAARPFANPAPVMFKTRVQNLLTVCEGGNALDIGAGCLRNSIYLQSAGFRVTALDVPAIEERFPEQYQRFRQKGGRVVLKKLSERGRYHFAVCTFVIESICRPSERLDLLSAARHALRPHGFLVISTRGPEDVVTARADGV